MEPKQLHWTWQIYGSFLDREQNPPKSLDTIEIGMLIWFLSLLWLMETWLRSSSTLRSPVILSGNALMALTCISSKREVCCPVLRQWFTKFQQMILKLSNHLLWDSLRRKDAEISTFLCRISTLTTLKHGKILISLKHPWEKFLRSIS